MMALIWSLIISYKLCEITFRVIDYLCFIFCHFTAIISLLSSSTISSLYLILTLLDDTALNVISTAATATTATTATTAASTVAAADVSFAIEYKVVFYEHLGSSDTSFFY